MLSRVWAWAFLGVMIVFFVIAVPLASSGAVNFLTLRNSQNILVAITPVLLLGLGQTFVIISAGIDLSVGWVMSLASVLSALAIRAAYNSGAPLFLAAVAGLAAALAGAGLVGLHQRRDHRQAQGAGLHRDPGQLLHRPRGLAAHVRKHHRDRAAGRHPQLRQRRADLLHQGRGRRPVLPEPPRGHRRSACAAWTRSCPIRW